jgi:hypothetical protein
MPVGPTIPAGAPARAPHPQPDQDIACNSRRHCKVESTANPTFPQKPHPIRRRDQAPHFYLGSASCPVQAVWGHLPFKDLAMQNGRKTPRHSDPGPPSTSRPNRWTPNIDRPNPNGFGSAQRSYERYLALAQEEIRCGNIVAAENYYQHAEHYYRSMSGDRGGAS